MAGRSGKSSLPRHRASESSGAMTQSWEREISKEIKMSVYIENLTNDIIRKHHLVRIFNRTNNEEFLNYVVLGIRYEEVVKMSPQTLGRIMCSINSDDIPFKDRDSLWSRARMHDNTTDLLRDLVCLSLAYVIRKRMTAYVGRSATSVHSGR